MINKDSIRIAIVDDDPMILRVFSSMTKQANYHADFFPSSREALTTIGAHPKLYDLVVSDICMPDEDGVAFARKARTLNPNMPFMFMTGGGDSEKRREALSLGRVTFLEKPFSLIREINENIVHFLENK